MTGDVTIGLAFLAGIISFISPCVLPLVPAYVGYMGGRITRQVTQTGAATQSVRQRFGTLTHGVFFVLGFTLFFVFFGLLTTAAVSSLTSLGVTEGEVRDGIARIGGTAVILFGLHIMGALNRVFGWLLRGAAWLDRNPYGNVVSALVGIAAIGAIYWLFVESWFLTLVVILVLAQLFRDALKADTAGQFWSRIILHLQTALYVDTRRQSQPKNQYGYLGSLFMGVVFSAGWTPCIGPIYGTVLIKAASGGSVSEAGTLMTAYSLGLGIPFLLTALALDQAQGLFRRLQRNMRAIEAFSGAFLILIGVLVFSGQLERLTRIGGSQGAFGDLSLNLENCAIAVVEGQVRLGNARDCLSDGVKEDFYIADPKGIELVSAEASTSENSASFPDLAAESGGEGSTGLDVPSLDASAPTGAALPEPDAPAAVNAPVGLEIGQRAPDFEAQTLDGETVALSDYRGQMVLVNFWATWCGPCREEMPDFETIYNLHRAEGFVVLAVNNQEEPDTVRTFADELGLTFPIVLDETGTINSKLYRSAIQGYPTSLLLDPDGIIVQRFSGLVDGAQLLNALDSRPTN
ncbi:MAG: redoxin domain-containing protein [Chloroflexi bacterium]|nr:redoxin domain-containing protein [Chloroflexota bacterium]